MRKYISLFRIKLIAGLQYRVAAMAGIVTQFVWGFMFILLFKAFYEADASSFPMSFDSIVSYIWLQQAFLALFGAWLLDNDIIETIRGGSIAYEMCRPVQIYPMWFFKSLANRLSRMLLRSSPILLTTLFMPEPFRLRLPTDICTILWFLLSLALSALIVVAFGMITYTICIHTISSAGIRIVMMGVVEFFSGSIIPLPFFPNKIRAVVELLPFASMQNVPLRIYSGDIVGTDVMFRVTLQIFWLVTIYLVGYYLMNRTLRNVVVQGG